MHLSWFGAAALFSISFSLSLSVYLLVLRQKLMRPVLLVLLSSTSKCEKCRSPIRFDISIDWICANSIEIHQHIEYIAHNWWGRVSVCTSPFDYTVNGQIRKESAYGNRQYATPESNIRMNISLPTKWYLEFRVFLRSECGCRSRQSPQSTKSKTIGIESSGCCPLTLNIYQKYWWKMLCSQEQNASRREMSTLLHWISCVLKKAVFSL